MNKTKYNLRNIMMIGIMLMMVILMNFVNNISAITEVTYSYSLNAVFGSCSGGSYTYMCPSIPAAIAHINENVRFITTPTLVTVVFRILNVRDCVCPTMYQNPNVSYRIVMENGSSLKGRGIINCYSNSPSIIPNDPSIVSLEVRNMSLTSARLALSHSPNVLIENCIFGVESHIWLGEYTPENKFNPEAPRKDTTIVMRNVLYDYPNVLMISQYTSIYLSGIEFNREYYPHIECLFANSESFIWENSEIRLILFVELIDNVEFKNTITLDNAYVSVTQARNVVLENVTSDRLLDLPYPVYFVSFSVFANIRNCNISTDSPWLYSSSMMTISFENITISDSQTEGSMIAASSVKSLKVNNCSFQNIRATCFQMVDIFDFEITNSNFTNIESKRVNGTINYTDHIRSNLKTFSGIREHKITKSNFENCEGGALNLITQAKTFITDCNFKNNTGQRGGAIYYNEPTVKNLLEVSNSKFISNGSPSTYGGALFIVGGAALTNNVFSRNSAEKGGVVFLGEGTSFPSVSFVNKNEFTDNTAQKGRIGFSEYENKKAIYKSMDRNSSIFENGDVTSRCFSFKYEIVDAGSGKKISEDNVITPYLGQTLIVSITPLDIYGREIIGPWSKLSLSLDNNNYLLRTNSRTINFPKTLDFTIFSHEKVTSLGKFNLTLSYDKASIGIQIAIANCPPLHIFDAAGCVNIWYWIPIASILSSCIVGISLIAIIFLIFARYKSQLLKIRKRADKEMEQVLLDKRIIFESEEEPPQKTSGSTFIIPTNDIKIIKKIGEGGQGTVYQAKWNSRDVAIKSLKKDGLDDNDEFEKEVSLLMSLSHPNIVSLFGFCIPNPNQKYMVIEFMKGGSLDKLITECKVGRKTLSLKEKLNILVEVARGMNYLHTLKPNMIAHRDLKPQNILLDEYRSVKICDFGLSRLIGANTTLQTSMTLNIGTLLYCPPENFVESRPSFEFVGNMSGFSYESFVGGSMMSIGSGSVSSSVLRDERFRNASKTDVYSFGIIMWSLFFEEDPYTVYNHKKMNYFFETEEGNAFNVITQIVKGKRPTIPFSTDSELEQWSREFIEPHEKRALDEFLIQGIITYMNLMQKCWHQIPQERPSFESVLCDLYEIMHLCGGSMLV